MANDHPEQDETRKRAYELRRAILDYGMGVVIFCIGIVLLIAPKIGLTVDLDNTLRYALGGLFLLYGGFRIYRGRQKNYYH